MGMKSVRWAFAGLLIAGLAGGCLYDAANRCGEYEDYNSDKSACVCAEGAVPANGHCEPCGANEVVNANQCVCEDGFVRGSDGVCEVKTSGQGDACNETDTPCVDEDHPFCALEDATDGYCTTTGCTSNDDCIEGYSCDQVGSPSFCKRPPTGLGMPCTEAADCEGFEAAYCDTVVSNSCLLQGCSLAPDDCPVGYACCDLPFGGVGLICLPEGVTCPS